MSFRWPYASRIVARLTVAGVTHPPVELFRSQRALTEWDWIFWSRDLGPDWEVWRETHTPEFLVCGGRPIPASFTTRGRDAGGRLKPEEKRAVEALRDKPEACAL